MSVVFVLIGVSLMMALGFLGAFIWAQKTGQNDDLYTPSVRILFEDYQETTVSKQTHK
ncbi:MAG: cbb3-type cytochrome oxidase assembly protein CcoS [Bacteroidota bacterium]|nr:cbb3-type cytochrome oxidase assembly protein CcoS [Bacteroidota bacterium]